MDETEFLTKLIDWAQNNFSEASGMSSDELKNKINTDDEFYQRLVDALTDENLDPLNIDSVDKLADSMTKGNAKSDDKYHRALYDYVMATYNTDNGEPLFDSYDEFLGWAKGNAEHADRLLSEYDESHPASDEKDKVLEEEVKEKSGENDKPHDDNQTNKFASIISEHKFG